MKSFTYTLILLYFYIFSSCKGDSRAQFENLGELVKNTIFVA